MGDNLEVFASWRDQAAQSKYPFTDFSECLSVSGVPLPASLFLDVSLVSSQDARVQLVSLLPYETALLAVFQNEFETETFQAVLGITAGETASNLTENGRVCGLVVYDPSSVQYFLSKYSTAQVFQDSAELCPRCIHVVVKPGVQSLAAGDLLGNSGVVFLIGENGVVLRQVDLPLNTLAPNDPTKAIRVDVVGNPLYDAETCFTADSAVGLAATSINQVRPNSRGSLTLIVDRRTSQSALRVAQGDDPSTLTFSITGLGK